MAVTSNRSVTITFSGDVEFSQIFEADPSSSGSGNIVKQNLVNGANTITPPTNAIAVTIIPPEGNATSITLKGVTGDTGIVLHLTDPTSIGLGSASTFCLTAGSAITGIRLIYN